MVFVPFAIVVTLRYPEVGPVTALIVISAPAPIAVGVWRTIVLFEPAQSIKTAPSLTPFKVSL